MIEHVNSLAPPPIQPPTATPQSGAKSEQASRFANALYAALRPPNLDFAEASGDFEHEDATKPAMTATVLPKPTLPPGRT